jgi:hypothetical protein
VLVTAVRVEEELITADEDGGTAMLLGALRILKGTVDDDGITADEDVGILGVEDEGSDTTGTLGTEDEDGIAIDDEVGAPATEDEDDNVETLLLVAAVLDVIREDEGVTVKV